MNHFSGGWFIDLISKWLEAWGYRYIEVPSLVVPSMYKSCVEGTDNRMFNFDEFTALMPEVTNYIKSVGQMALGSNKVYYVARCFRDETTTDSERLREFTQIGVEILGENALDCCKIVRKDAINLFKKILGESGWKMENDVKRGLNLYDGKTFEIHSEKINKQLLGGGSYVGGAGWAVGLERLMKASNEKISNK